MSVAKRAVEKVSDILYVFLASFWWVFLMLIILFVPFLRVWWWVFFPLLLATELRVLYLWWMNWDYAYAKKKWVVLEIIPPKEVLTPLKAMEDVFSVMWSSLYSSAGNWREKWCEGSLTDADGWMSWEIVSIEGALHFYARVLAQNRESLETVLYSHYPELEITPVADYAKQVPQNVPNTEWDTYGEDFILMRPPGYPIRTYEKFFEPQGEKISAEEKRIDPISSLLELLSKMGPGEQYWLQFITMPVSDGENPEVKDDATKIVSKLAKRPTKKPKTFFDTLAQTAHDLVLGPVKEGSGEKASYKWLQSQKTEEGDREMVLTPGEREMITEVENKYKKPLFRTNIRGVYVARRDAWQSAHRLLARAYFAHFASSSFNYFRFSTLTRPKTSYLFRQRIPFIRSRRMFRNYVLRFPPLFPDRKGECALLNTEELTTIFHFPLKITGLVAPTMSRVESKKGGPPPNLPTE